MCVSFIFQSEKIHSLDLHLMTQAFQAKETMDSLGFYSLVYVILNVYVFSDSYSNFWVFLQIRSSQFVSMSPQVQGRLGEFSS